MSRPRLRAPACWSDRSPVAHRHATLPECLHQFVMPRYLTVSYDSVSIKPMDGWTLDELAGRVAQALAADDVRAPNGRVREVPDGRAIRWYTTIGLVDRPLGFRGRTALYGPRHLLQIVAVKRRQAAGLALADIQSELAGATDDTLGRVAKLPHVGA